MIFQDLLLELQDGVADAVQELFVAAEANQSHPQDMLLVDQHGFMLPMLADVENDGGGRLSPYVIGPAEIGSADSTLYEFLDWYRKSHILDRAEWEQASASDANTQKHERLCIQVEQGIYLRFWEAESVLKRYCQLSSLATGNPYDWQLTIPSHPRQGSKQEFIRKKIRDRVKEVCPKFFALIKENYKSQVRDAIGHSQFYMVGKAIRLLNHSPVLEAYAPLATMTFDSWYRQFHTTLLLHNETISAFSRFRKGYEERALARGNRLEIRIAARGLPETLREVALHASGRWVWKENLRRTAGEPDQSD